MCVGGGRWRGGREVNHSQSDQARLHVTYKCPPRGYRAALLFDSSAHEGILGRKRVVFVSSSALPS